MTSQRQNLSAVATGHTDSGGGWNALQYGNCVMYLANQEFDLSVRGAPTDALTQHTLQVNNSSRQIPQPCVFTQERQIRFKLVTCITQPFSRDVTRHNKSEVIIEPFDGRIESIGERVFE